MGIGLREIGIIKLREIGTIKLRKIGIIKLREIGIIKWSLRVWAVRRGGCVPTSARLEDAVETGDEHSKLVLQGVAQRADHGRDGLLAHHTGQTRVVSEQEPVGLIK